MLSRETVKIKNLDFAQFECFRYLYRCDLVVELQKGVERAEKYRYGREKHPKDGIEKKEYRFFISSLKADIELFSRAVRGYWSLESMHWHLDVTFSGETAAIFM